MNYTKYANSYIKTIKSYLNQPTEFKDHQIYEILWALKLELILWKDIPPNFNQIYDLPHTKDYGIDLISLDYDQVSQVKHYGANSTINWTAMSTFYTYSNGLLQINNMILTTTTTATIDKMAQKLIKDNNIIVLRKNLDKLIEELQPQLDSFQIQTEEEDIEIEELTIDKRPYLLECSNAFLEFGSESSSESSSESDSELELTNIFRAQLPPGTGKTYIMLHIIQEDLQEYPDEKHIIFCPWIDLARQTYNLFLKFGVATCFIGDGSTSVDEDASVIICIYNSVEYVKDLGFKYKFVDEAHHLELEESVRRIAINNIDCFKCGHFSATFHEQDTLDFEYGMDEAITDGYISDYKIHFEYFSEGDRFPKLVEMIKNNIHWFPAFIYFNSVAKCVEFSGLLVSAGVSSDYLTGDSTSTKRETVKSKVMDYSLDIVCLCGVYNEGISIDCLQTVIFGDLRHSETNRFQIATRANRLCKDKAFYRVVVPLIEGDWDSVGELIRSFGKIDSSLLEAVKGRSVSKISVVVEKDIDAKVAELLYEGVYDRMGVLLEGIDVFEVKYEELRLWIGENDRIPNKRSKTKLEKSLESWCSHRRSDKKSGKLDDIKIEKLDSLPYWFWQKEDPFDDKFNELKTWIGSNDRIPSQMAKNKIENSLGNWCSSKRGDKRKDKLDDTKTEKLESLPHWYWEKEDPFDAKFNELKTWIETNDKIPATDAKDKIEKSLGSWCSHKRGDKKSGRLDDANAEKLDSLPHWFWQKEDPFDDKFNELKTWIETNDRFPCKTAENAVEKSLGNWCSNKRKDNKSKKLDNIKIEKLESLPHWYWNMFDDLFDVKLNELNVWIETNARIPSKMAIDKIERSLGSWCTNKRSDKKKGKLYDTKIKRLESLPYWYWVGTCSL
jgi:superfamily II DNA/RNA helicase